MTHCLLLHGAGSDPRFIDSAFGPAVRRRGWRLLAPDVRGMSMAQAVAVIERAELSPDDVLGGVSLGAHAAAFYCARTGWAGRLYAVMPAWLGSPDAVAGLTEDTADRICLLGVQKVLAEIAAHTTADDWILAELRRAWGEMSEPDLVHALRVAGQQPAPTIEDLAAVRARTRIVALRDDPTHPEQVARTWTDAIRGAGLQVLPRDAGPRRLADELWD